MKKKILLLTLATLFTVFLTHAQSVKRIYKTRAITFYGLDFTKTAFIGDFSPIGENQSATKVKDVFMVEWNDILINERRKYNFSEAYRKDSIYYKIKVSKDRNSKIDTNSIFKHEFDNCDLPHLKNEDLQTIVNEIEDDANTSLGFVYVVDFYNKKIKRGCIWVVFFDTKTKEIIHKAAFIEEASGMGVKNFWSSVVHRTILTSQRLYNSKWRRL